MSAKQGNARKTTSSYSGREKMRRKPLNPRNSPSISLRFSKAHDHSPKLRTGHADRRSDRRRYFALCRPLDRQTHLSCPNPPGVQQYGNCLSATSGESAFYDRYRKLQRPQRTWLRALYLISIPRGACSARFGGSLSRVQLRRGYPAAPDFWLGGFRQIQR
jgi:hypothetical protein